MSTPNQKLVTYENVAIAAKALVDSGKLASVRAVIGMMGGGSPNAVLPLLNQWKESNPNDHKDELALDPGIGALISKQIKVACKQAVASTQAQLDELLADSVLLARAGEAADDLNAQLRAQLEQANAQIQHLTGRLSEQLVEIERARALAVTERQATDALRMEMVRAKTLAEAVPKLEAENGRLSLLLRTTEGELAQARLDGAVAKAKFEAQIERTEDCVRERDLLLKPDISK